MKLVKVTGDSTTTPVSEIDTSHSPPLVGVTNLTIANPRPSEDGSKILSTVTIAGSLQSAFCDIIAGANGIIDSVRLFLNGSKDPVATIATVPSKSSQNSFLRPFPFAATFNQTIEDFELSPGNNVFEITAVDSSGVSGFSQFTTVVEARAPGVILGHRLRIEFINGPINPAVINTIRGTLFLRDDPDQEGKQTPPADLVETGIGTMLFKNANNTFVVSLTSGDPVYYATLKNTGAGILSELFVLREDIRGYYEGENIRLAEDYEFSNWVDWRMDLPGGQALGATGSGQTNTYMMQLIGPSAILDQIDHIETLDGNRYAKQAFDGNYYISTNLPAGGYTPSIFVFQPTDDFKSIVLKGTEFYIGFGKGFWAGGVSMVEGIGKIIIFNAKHVLAFYPSPWFASFGGLRRKIIAEDTEIVINTAGFLKQVANIYISFMDNQNKAVMGWITGQNDSKEISGPYLLAFEFCGEVIEQLFEDYKNASPEKKGYIMGRATFEIITLLVAELKIGKITKLEFLTKLKNRDFFKTEAGAGVFAKLADFMSGLAVTKMCFIAGTKIHTQNGLKSIENILVGDLVLSREEKTGTQAFKSVRETFTTHPSSLIRIKYQTHGIDSGQSEITCTRQHPFYISQKKRFVAAEELEIGDHFQIANGSYAAISALIREEAKTGRTFTTYNFEVEEFHTYFVGQEGIWVHNAATSYCQMLYSIYFRYRKRFNKTVEEAWRVIEENRYFAAGSKNVSDTTMASALEEVLLKDVYNNPSLKLWTKGPDPTPADNMWKHYKQHVKANKSGIPGGEFPNIHDAVTYVKTARQFVNETGPDVITWSQGTKKAFLNKANKRYAIQQQAGSEAGAINTFFVSNSKNAAGNPISLYDWAVDHGYQGDPF